MPDRPAAEPPPATDPTEAEWTDPHGYLRQMIRTRRPLELHHQAIAALLSDFDARGSELERERALVKGQVVRMRAQRATIDRLRARTHEIQAEEMAKRAALDSEIAEWRRRFDEAKRWTEREGFAAEWAVGEFSFSPFWGMTSYNARSALLRLVTERDEARTELTRLRAERDEAHDEALHWHNLRERLHTELKPLVGDQDRENRSGDADVDLIAAVRARVGSAGDAERRAVALSGLLRGMARRLGALRRDYNTGRIDPWENPEYCAKATPGSPCGPVIRDYDLCIYHLREQMAELSRTQAAGDAGEAVVGRCGAAPPLTGLLRLADVPVCNLPVGHPGWHRDVHNGVEWGRIRHEDTHEEVARPTPTEPQRTTNRPTRVQIAEAIEAALDTACMDVTLTHDGHPSDVEALGRVLDKAGLIDWTAVTGCRNCDGRRCMSCCFREVHDQCVDDCPHCCAGPVPEEAT